MIKKFQPIRNSAPCKDCSERYTACHDKCEKYKAWKETLEKIKEEKKKYEQCRYNTCNNDYYKH